MKAIIESFSDKHVWKEYDQNPYLVCVLGKRLIDFYIDFCILSKITDIILVIEDFDQALLNYIKKYSKTDIKITIKFRSTLSENELKSVGEDAIVFKNYSIICYDKRNPEKSEDLNKIRQEFSKFVSEDSLEINLKPDEKLPDYVMLRYKSIGDFFEISMGLLKNYLDLFSINGYAVENNIHMGMFDIIMQNVEFIPNVILGNNVKIGNNCKIGPNVIIEDDTIIEDNCVIENTIMTSVSYVGSMNIKDKIIHEQTIIDPLTNNKLYLTGYLFYENPNKPSSRFIKILRPFTSLFILLILFPFTLIFALLGRPKDFTFITFKKDNKIIRAKHYNNTSTSWKDRYFFKFSQDKVPLLLLAMFNKMEITGDSITCALHPESLKLYGDFFSPGVFSVPDALNMKYIKAYPLEDLRYKNHKTFFKDIRVVVHTLIFRLFR